MARSHETELKRVIKEKAEEVMRKAGQPDGAGTKTGKKGGKKKGTSKKNKGEVPKAQMTTSKKKDQQQLPKELEEVRGKRKVPEAADKHGCKHCGLRDLKTLQKNYLNKYVKEGDWLHNKPCKDCARKEKEDGNAEGRVLDMASLLSS